MPPPGRLRELWMNHAAGFLLFEDVRGYARSVLPAELDPATRAVAHEAIDHAVYGLMMVIDRIPGPFRNDDNDFGLRVIARVTRKASDEVVESLDLFDHGEGMTMGFHGWVDGDFGEAPVTAGQRGHGGMIQADGEGFYDGRDLILAEPGAALAASTMPRDELAFRRSVRNLVKRIVSGEITDPVLASAGDLVLPPGGFIFPILQDAPSHKEDRRWTGSIRLFRRSPKGPQPTQLVARVEVVEHPDRTVDVELQQIVEAPTARRRT